MDVVSYFTFWTETGAGRGDVTPPTAHIPLHVTLVQIFNDDMYSVSSSYFLHGSGEVDVASCSRRDCRRGAVLYNHEEA